MPENFPQNLQISADTLPLIKNLGELLPGGFFMYHAYGTQELIYFNSKMVELFGCANEAAFRELTGNSFKGIVHPDEYEETENSIRQQIASGADNMDHVKYRFIRQDGTVGMMDDYGHFSRSESFGEVYYVFVQDVSKQYYADLEKKRAAEVQRRELMAKLSGSESTYIGYPETDRFTAIGQNTYLRENYPADETFSASIARYIENDVYAPDRKKAAEEIRLRRISNRLRYEKEYSFRFRDISKGSPRWYELKAARLSGTEILFSFSDIDDAVTEQILYDKLQDGYFGLYYVNLETGFAKIIRTGHPELTGEVGTVREYKGLMEAIAAASSGETVEFLEKVSHVGYLKERFQKEDLAFYTYPSFIFEGSPWISVTGRVLQRKEDGSPELFAIGFSLMDEKSSEAEAAKASAVRSELEKLLDSISASYDLVYLVDMADDSVFLRKLGEGMLESGQHFSTFSEAREFSVQNVIHPRDRARMLRELDFAVIRDRLKKEASYDVEYTILKHGATLWGRMHVLSVTENRIIIGFAELDLAVGKQLLADKRFDEYMALYSVDADTQTIRALRTNALYRTIPEGGTGSYPEVLKNFSALYSGETAAFFRRLSGLAYAKTLFSDSDKFTHAFKSVKLENDFWIEAVGYCLERHADGSPALFTLGFMPADALAAAFYEAQAHMKIDIQMIGGLAGEYYALYYYNIKENIFKLYTLDKERFPQAAAIVEAGGDPAEILRRFGTSALVHPDDRKLFANITGAYIQEKLAHSKKYFIRFRRIFNGEFLWAEMDFIKYGDYDEPASAIAIGFANVNEDVKRQQEEAVLHSIADQQRHIQVFGDMINAGLWSINIGRDNAIKEVYWSNEFRRMFGYEETEAAFPNVLASWTDLLHPEDKEPVLADFYRGIRSTDTASFVYDVQYRVLHKNGEYRWYHAIGRMEDTGSGERRLYGIIVDISADKELEEKLALSDGLAREYHTVWLVDGFGEHKLHLFRSTGRKTVQKALQLGLDNSGYDSFIVKYITDCVHEDDRARVLEAARFETVARETPDVGTYVISYLRYCDDEGNTDYHQMCFAKALAPDGTVNYILAYRDADKMLREQLAQQKQLAEALSMAESANRAKTTFLNNMSHDIRTPMNAIIGYTGLAASHIENTVQVQDYLGKIAQSSGHLLSLINDVLDMSRIESGKMNIDEKPESLPEVMHTLRDIIQADIHARHHDFFIDTVNVNDEHVICDKLRLNQVLLNILSNAIKYTAPGGTISMRIVEKAVKPNGYGTYEFRIKDNGMGMEKKLLDKIFDPFTRGKSSTVSGIQGTGLGMAITKNIIDMMGGVIEISSAPGKGTEVVVTFEFRLAAARKEDMTVPELAGLRALVADDDANTCVSIEKMLKAIGMRSEWCTSGKEAVFRAEHAYTSGDLFRVYIIDWLMPDMNGIETVRRIRRVIGDDAPIIILTAYDWSDIEEEARAAGVTAFVSKPMFPSELRRVLCSCLGRTAQPMAETAAPAYDFAGKKILLVEDNELNREIAEELLTDEGFIVDTAEDGTVAVEKMQQAESGAYDLILMDVQMPVMDGYTATRAIRAMGTELSKIPILAMTANAFAEDRALALEAGMNEHIAKPIDVEKLKQMLAKFLAAPQTAV